MEAFPVSNSECDAIAVYDEADSSSSRSINAADNDLVEVVYIKDFGYFSRAQIELFKRVENLKNACVLGGKLKVWLLQEVIGSVDAHIHGEVRAFADQVLTTYPYAQINGLEAIPDHDFSMLYRAAPPVWLSDACIRALCERLVHDFASARFAGVQNAKQQPKRTRNRQSQEVDPCVLEKVREAAAISNMETVMIPVNFENSHWCALIVKTAERRIYYYDSLMQGAFSGPLREIANSIRRLELHHFDVSALTNPCQKDVYNCGVFVCWVFIRHVVDDASRLFAAHNMNARRFELFYYILTGKVNVLRERTSVSVRRPLSVVLHDINESYGVDLPVLPMTDIVPMTSLDSRATPNTNTQETQPNMVQGLQSGQILGVHDAPAVPTPGDVGVASETSDRRMTPTPGGVGADSDVSDNSTTTFGLEAFATM
ncbi:hypothetical protein PF003_g33115 [Phytophthora fragariae]|nr:hypothetical protein PF003_g33115 [Phytophthora fragariae]